MWKTLREYAFEVGRAWLAAVIGIVAGAIGLALSVLTSVTVPTAAWVALMVVGLFVAQFIAFRKVSNERDELERRIDKRGLLADLLRFKEKGGELLSMLGLWESDLRLHGGSRNVFDPENKVKHWVSEVCSTLETTEWAAVFGDPTVRTVDDEGLGCIQSLIETVKARLGYIDTIISRL